MEHKICFYIVLVLCFLRSNFRAIVRSLFFHPGCLAQLIIKKKTHYRSPEISVFNPLLISEISLPHVTSKMGSDFQNCKQEKEVQDERFSFLGGEGS